MIIRPADTNRGFALPALIFFLTAATILIAATVPIYQMQAKRAQEEELIFRGEEYARAIQKFQRKFNGAKPPSLEALVETNGIRFVRKLYTDPITGKPFRVISIDANGMVIGSTLYNAGANNRGPFGQTSPAQMNLTPPQMQQSPNSGPSTQQTQGPQKNQPPANTKSGGGFATTNPQVNNNSNNRSSQSGIGNSQTVGTAGIIGVASENEGESIKVYNGRQKYNEWEFFGVIQTAQQNLPNQQQNPANQQNPFNQQNPANQQNPFNPQNPANQQNPFNPQNPANQQNPFNPQNPANQQNPFNPQNPANQQNPFNQNNQQRPSVPTPGFGPSTIPQPGFNQPNQNQPRSPFGFGPPQQQQQQQPNQPVRRPN